MSNGEGAAAQDRDIREAIRKRKLIVQGPDRRYWGADVDWQSPGVVVIRLDTIEQWLYFADRYGLELPEDEA
jgi:hypothetical protein